ncbi:MAG: T9SS type A sorting domain-containing protein [Paludibacter sp.]|nr:T9SS type A sorting domain-containing protein [Paludibacter sp.]
MKMKLIRIVFTLVLFSFYTNVSAQDITFEYDDSGNCTLKYKTVVLPSHAKQNTSSTDTIATEPQKEMIGEREVIIYPNPTKGALKIGIKGSVPENPAIFLLTDLNGRLLVRKETTETIYLYDMTSFSTGVYLLRVIIDGKMKEWKIVKE